MCTKNHNHMNFGTCDRERLTEFFVILGHFLPFYPPLPPDNLEKQNFDKTNTEPEDIINFTQVHNK